MVVEEETSYDWADSEEQGPEALVVPKTEEHSCLMQEEKPWTR
jgi:hypothetical protein